MKLNSSKNYKKLLSTCGRRRRVGIVGCVDCSGLVQAAGPGMRDASTTSQSSITFEQQQQQFALEAARRGTFCCATRTKKKEKSHAKKRKQKQSQLPSAGAATAAATSSTTSASSSSSNNKNNNNNYNKQCPFQRLQIRLICVRADHFAQSKGKPRLLLLLLLPLPLSQSALHSAALPPPPHAALKTCSSCKQAATHRICRRSDPFVFLLCFIAEEYPAQTSFPLEQLLFLHQLSRLLNLPNKASCKSHYLFL